MKSNTNNILETVKQILTDIPKARNRRYKDILYCKFYEYYYGEAKGAKIQKVSMMSFFRFVATKQIVDPLTIDRANRKVQEQNVALRGSDYKERKKLEQKIRNEHSSTLFNVNQTQHG